MQIALPATREKLYWFFLWHKQQVFYYSLKDWLLSNWFLIHNNVMSKVCFQFFIYMRLLENVILDVIISFQFPLNLYILDAR